MRGLLWKANFLLLRGKMKLEEFLSEERGDTNFISIAIVLLIVIVIAAVFLKVGKQVTEAMEKSVTEFLKTIK